uniref:Uncharacterized protein LOC111110564 isoform X2 n=1 Tax=Crassostrea virginica TaxID=6565 RepID=A0A8B8BHH8_CRAVI|nr:uncharacterized protein LOC111110564 isoform X2 [Crassostrea virginica]
MDLLSSGQPHPGVRRRYRKLDRESSDLYHNHHYQHNGSPGQCLSSFLALVFICLVSVAILKYCHILCRQRTRVKDDEEEVETGCCYTCCIHCFASGCRGCFTVRNVTPRPSEYPPSPRPSVRSVSIQAEEIPTLSLEEVVTSKRMAKELKNYWKPHRHDLRNNNQSTK